MINDQNRERTESPKNQESQTQQDYNLVHILSMRKTPTRLSFLTRVAVLIEDQGEQVRPKHGLCQAQVASFEQASIFQCRHTHLAGEPFHASFVNAVPEKTVGAQWSKLSYTLEGLSKIARVSAYWQFAPVPLPPCSN
jgi:hypothetical protein